MLRLGLVGLCRLLGFQSYGQNLSLTRRSGSCARPTISSLLTIVCCRCCQGCSARNFSKRRSRFFVNTLDLLDFTLPSLLTHNALLCLQGSPSLCALQHLT